MDLESMKFGRGPRELGGSIDLINHYKLRPFHEIFCMKSMSSSISADSRYLHNVVGDTKINKGEGMELDQLFHTNIHAKRRCTELCPFDLHILKEAFQIREPTSIDLASQAKGIPVSLNKNEKKRKKHEGREKRDHKKHKHRKEENS